MVDRYGHGCWPDEDWGKKPDGPYVRYGDYLAMLARAEKAEKKLANISTAFYRGRANNWTLEYEIDVEDWKIIDAALRED